MVTLHSFVRRGIEGLPVRVDVSLAPGLPQFDVLGIEDPKETRVRIRASMHELGYPLNNGRLMVEIVGAAGMRGVTTLDLPCALGLLAELEGVDADVADCGIVGELSFSGAVRAVRGLLSIVSAAKAAGHKRVIVPAENLLEACAVEGIEVYGVSTLKEAWGFLTGREAIAPGANRLPRASATPDYGDLAEIAGNASAKRALEIAAAGNYNLLLVGPPGAGKTALARRMCGILPAMNPGEALEATALHSIAGILPPDAGLLSQRPFRAPHHTVSTVGMFGGGDPARPGEVSLAHGGVLFLDELSEFRREVTELLKATCERGGTRAYQRQEWVNYPARFSLICAMNPCPCGYHGMGDNRCVCRSERVREWRERLSWFNKAHIDVYATVTPALRASREPAADGFSSAEVRDRVKRARDMAAGREEPKRALRFERVARTIADLAGSVEVQSAHTEEAMQVCRPLW